MGISNNMWGLVLAVLSSLFIGASCILKKKGIRRAIVARTHQVFEPLWLAGMITMIVGEVANCVAYIYSPAVLVAPVGALSITISAVLAHLMLKERLRKGSTLGCVACIVGSIIIVIYAPREHTPSTYAQEVWILAIQPAFLVFATTASALVFVEMRFLPPFLPLIEGVTILVNLGLSIIIARLVLTYIQSYIIMESESTRELGIVEGFRDARGWFCLSIGHITMKMRHYRDEVLLDTFNSYIMMRSLTIGGLALHYFFTSHYGSI